MPTSHFEQRIHKSQRIFFAFLIAGFFIWIIFSAFIAGKMLSAHGLIGDSITYFHIVSHFSSILPHHLPVYEIQRLLPLLSVQLLSKIAGISTATRHNVILLFGIMNTILLIIAVWMWWLIGKKLAWNFEARLLAFCGLFLNYFVLKSYGYNPVVTDPSAFFAGLLIYYFFISNKKWCLLLTSLLSAFIYPVVIMLMGLCLFFFPNRHESNQNQIISEKIGFNFYMAITILSLLYFIWGVTIYFYDLFHPIVITIKTVGITFSELLLILSTYKEILMNPENSTTLVTILICAIFIFYYFLFALKSFYTAFLSLFYKRSTWIRIGKLIFIIFIMHYCFVFYSNGSMNSHHSGVTAPEIILDIAYYSTTFPLVFLVSHVVYFGPIICLGIFLWKDIVNYVWNKNVGFFLVLGFYIFFGTNTVSRQLTNFFPIFVIIITDIMNKRNISILHVIIFGVLSLVISEVWLPIHQGLWPEVITPDNYHFFPLSWRLMDIGANFIPLNYAIDAMISLISLFLIFTLFLRNKVARTDLQ